MSSPRATSRPSVSPYRCKQRAKAMGRGGLLIYVKFRAPPERRMVFPAYGLLDRIMSHCRLVSCLQPIGWYWLSGRNPRERSVMTNLLVVDDEANVVSALRRMLLNPAALPALREPHLTTFTSPVEALEYVASHHLDLVISDYRMPVMDGVSFLPRVKELQPDTARI